MSHWQAVERVAPVPPFGDKLIHQGHETAGVSWFEQVNYLVNHNVL